MKSTTIGIDLAKSVFQVSTADASQRIVKRQRLTRSQFERLIATTASAAMGRVNDIHAFKRGRAFASWLGLTPREYSSGNHRTLGRISRRGDSYLRMLLIHGARAALLAAKRARLRGQDLTELQRWALETEARCGHNKASVALANKMARIMWAVWTRHDSFDGDHARRYH